MRDTIPEILYEDNHILAVGKLWGQIVQGDKTGDAPLSEILKDFIKERDGKPGNVFLGITHRIDRPASGVVLFAKTGKALSRLNGMFRNKEVDKIYWAVVEGRPPAREGRLEHVLRKNEKLNKSCVVDDGVVDDGVADDGIADDVVADDGVSRGGAPRQGGKTAVLHYKTLKEADRYTLLEVRIETGRHHQIRCQLAHIGCPVKGDLKYGAKRSNPGGGIHLHARSVSFNHPVKNVPVRITAEPPEDPVWRLFSGCGAENGTAGGGDTTTDGAGSCRGVDTGQSASENRGTAGV